MASDMRSFASCSFACCCGMLALKNNMKVPSITTLTYIASAASGFRVCH